MLSVAFSAAGEFLAMVDSDKPEVGTELVAEVYNVEKLLEDGDCSEGFILSSLSSPYFTVKS